MKELVDIVSAWETLCSEGRDAVLATVVGVSGSTYRRPGARMLLAPEGRLAGSVSGGCLEGDLVKKASWQTRNGPALITYDSLDADDDVVWGFGLGCNGVVQVLLERVTPEDPGPLRLLASVLKQRQPGVIATVISEDAGILGQRLLLLPDGSRESTITDAALLAKIEADAQDVRTAQKSDTRTYARTDGTQVVFLEAVLPPLPLVIFGAGHDALPLVRFAKELGWHVTVADTRAVSARPARFPIADQVLMGSAETICTEIGLNARTAVVVMTHNYPDDKRILRALLTSIVAYIGQLGPKARTERLLAEISDDGLPITEDHRKRLFGPVGLDLGADTPEQIALSIIAEIQAVLANRAAGSLRECRDSLHPHLAAVLPDDAREHASCAI